VVKTSIAPRKKKKKWWSIESPKALGGASVGQSTAYEASELKGRTVNITLAQLTGDMKKQGTYVTLQIKDVEDNKATTTVERIELSNGTIKRLVKRGRAKVSDSFVCKTKDEFYIRVKPLLITQSLTNRAMLTKLRKGARMIFKQYCTEHTYEELVLGITKSVVQKLMKEKLTKFYPLRVADVQLMKHETRYMRETVDEKGTDIVFERPKEEEEVAQDEVPNAEAES